MKHSNPTVIGAKCPVCGTEFTNEIKTVQCRDCLTIHHRDCFQYNRQCATYGCQCTELRFTPKVKMNNEYCYKSRTGFKALQTSRWKVTVPLYYRLLAFIDSHSRFLVSAYDLLTSVLICLVPFIYFLMWRHRINLWIFMTLFSEIAVITLKKEYVELWI